jgi:hypothetical protein
MCEDKDKLFANISKLGSEIVGEECNKSPLLLQNSFLQQNIIVIETYIVDPEKKT